MHAAEWDLYKVMVLSDGMVVINGLIIHFQPPPGALCDATNQIQTIYTCHVPACVRMNFHTFECNRVFLAQVVSLCIT